MRNKCALVFFLFLLVAGAGPVSAQEAGQVGVNLGYPLVGVTWHVTPTIAVRPEFTFMFGSSSSTSGGVAEGSDADTWGVAFGVSALFYVADWDGVKGYVAPRLAYSRTSTEAISTVTSSRRENTGTGFELGATGGVQYALNARFTVFGEVGLGYTRSHTEFDSSNDLVGETESWTIQPRTRVGVIVYF